MSKSKEYSLSHFVPEVRERLEGLIIRQKEMIGFQIKRMREYQQMSIEELSDLTGVGTDLIRRIEKGDIRTMEPIIILTDALGLVFSTILK